MATIVVADHDPAWRERLSSKPSGSGPPSQPVRSSTSARPRCPVRLRSRSLIPSPASSRRRPAWCRRSPSDTSAPSGAIRRAAVPRRLEADGTATHDLSLTTVGSTYWLDHLAFRDALRANADLRDRYGALKREQAAAHEDIDAYMRAEDLARREALLSVGHRPTSGWAATPEPGSRRRPDVARRRPDQPRLALRPQDARGPAGRARAHEQRREQLRGDLGQVEHDRRPELDVGGQYVVRLALAQRFSSAAASSAIAVSSVPSRVPARHGSGPAPGGSSAR